MEALRFIFVLFSIFCLVLGKPEKYSSRFDDFDIDQVLKSDRLLKNYANCLLEKGPCTNEGTELKKHLSEALTTDCGKCTDAQKEKAQKAIDYLRTNKKDLWQKLEDKYDPEHIFREKEGKRKGLSS